MTRTSSMAKTPSKQTADSDTKHGVQSAETVLQVLSSFVGAEPMPMLKTLAERTGMHPAKVHRYLVSLTRMGYVEQDPSTSRYRLGPYAMRLGFAAMSTVDALRVARPLMPGICQEIGHAVVMAIWSDRGPIVALRETAPGLLQVSASEGTVVPILRSSIGRAFGAWSPRERTAELIATELAEFARTPHPGCPATQAEVEALFQETRKRGLSRVTGQLSASVHSLSAPVFRTDNDLVAVLCSLGPAGEFDSTWSGHIARTLVASAATISRGLGHHA